MKLGTRLLLLFLAIALIPAAAITVMLTRGAHEALRSSIGANFRHLAMEGAANIEIQLNERIVETERLAERPAVVAAVRAANRAWEGRSEAAIAAEIRAADEAWIRSGGEAPVASKVLGSRVSAYLRDWAGATPDRYGEIFLTDKHGATIGATGKLSDYNQGDEQWWLSTLDGGRGQVFVDDHGYDESARAVVVGISVPVRDEGRVIGILKSSYNIGALFSLPLADHLPGGGRTFLARADGRVIRHAGAGGEPRLRAGEIAAMQSGHASWSEVEGAEGFDRLRAQAPVRVRIHARLSEPDAQPGVSGERWAPLGWHVFLDVGSEQAFAPLSGLRRQAIAVAVAALLLAALFAFATSRMISRPVRALRDGAEAIAAGDLGRRLPIRSGDEIGELARSFNVMAEALEKQMTALREREAQFGSVVNSAMDAIVSVDEDMRIVLYNSAAEKMFGHPAGAMLGQPLDRLIPQRRREAHQAYVREFGTSGITNRSMAALGAVSGLRADGSEFPIEASISQAVIAGRKIFTAILRDITERKKAEEALRRLNDDLERRVEERTAELRGLAESMREALEALDASRDGAYIFDAETLRFVYVNQGAVQQTGYGREELLQMTPVDIKPEFDEPRFRAMLVPLASGEQPLLTFRTVHRRKDGGAVPVEINLQYLAPQDSPARFVAIVRDITERQRSENALNQLNARLAASNRELERFAYVASHDLQEPLRTVASYLQLIERRYQDRLDDDGREFIGFAVDGATRMQGMIRDLLDYSRVQTQGRPFAAVDLNEALAEVLGDLRLAIEENAATVTHDALPVVMGDATQLRRLLQNLVGNALKYRNAEPPRIHLSARRIEDSTVKRPDAAPAAGWLISVEDNGIGIEARHYDRVFQLFQRLHGRGEYPGSGLGLALCKRIVERHGGAIWVESIPGKGSTFHVALPITGG